MLRTQEMFFIEKTNPDKGFLWIATGETRG